MMKLFFSDKQPSSIDLIFLYILSAALLALGVGLVILTWSNHFDLGEDGRRIVTVLLANSIFLFPPFKFSKMLRMMGLTLLATAS
jgi:hypothetical protein